MTNDDTTVDEECALPWTRERGRMLEVDLSPEEKAVESTTRQKEMKVWEESLSSRDLIHIMDPGFFGADSNEALAFASRVPSWLSKKEWESRLRKTGHFEG